MRRSTGNNRKQVTAIRRPWRFGSPMKQFTEETVVDRSSADKLADIITVAAESLSKLGDEPSLAYGDLTAPPGDGTDEYYAKVQVGGKKGERTAYSLWAAACCFNARDERARLENLKSWEFASLSESSSVLHEFPDKQLFEAGAAAEPPILAQMQEIIRDLEKSDWRYLSEKAFSSKNFRGLGVYLFHGGVWLVRRSNTRMAATTSKPKRTGFGAELWHLTNEGSLTHFARTELPEDTRTQRLRTIDAIVPIDLTDINTAAVDRVTGAAGNWLLPSETASSTSKSDVSRQEITQLFEDLAKEIRRCTPNPVTYHLGRSRDEHASACSEIYMAGNRFKSSFGRRYNWDPKTKATNNVILESAPDIIQIMGKIFDETLKQEYEKQPKAEFKDLFVAAFSSPLENFDQLYLKITPREVLFTRGFTLFTLLDGQLMPDRVLSAAEIETLYFSNERAGLVDWLKFKVSAVYARLRALL